MAKILVIEDQPEIVKMVTTRLKAAGYDVISADDGQAGMTMAQNEMPDLIITDLAMPKMNGNVVVRILKMSEKHKHIPIIMLSAFVNEHMGDAVDVPADAYLPKPFSSDTLLSKVAELLNEKPHH
jgi:DNA-binding response OmpR family regulator